MDITPSPEFLAACRIVLGGDSPTIVLSAIMNSGPELDEIRRVHAEIVELKHQPKSNTNQNG
jgi:hypothetical protein